MNAPTAPSKPLTTSTPATPSQNGQVKPAVSLSPSASKPVAMKKAPPFKMSAPNTAVGKWLKLFVYARPGAGKTTLLASAVDVPQMNDVLFINAEKGDLVIEDNERIKHPELLRDNIIPCDDFKTVAMVHDFLKSHCHFRDAGNEDKLREQEAWLRGCDPADIIKPKKFRTVIIDSLTEVDIYCTYGLLGITQDKVLHGESSDIEVARFDEFRKNNQMVQMLCRAFRDLPIHVLVTAHETFSEDELRKKYWMPQLTGQLRTQVPGFFDIVGWLTYQKEGENINRKLMVQPVGQFVAKNRRPVWKKDHFPNPTMLDIMKGIQLFKEDTSASS